MEEELSGEKQPKALKKRQQLDTEDNESGDDKRSMLPNSLRRYLFNSLRTLRLLESHPLALSVVQHFNFDKKERGRVERSLEDMSQAEEDLGSQTPTLNYGKQLGFGEIGRPRMGKRSPKQPCRNVPRWNLKMRSVMRRRCRQQVQQVQQELAPAFSDFLCFLLKSSQPKAAKKCKGFQFGETGRPRLGRDMEEELSGEKQLKALKKRQRLDTEDKEFGDEKRSMLPNSLGRYLFNSLRTLRLLDSQPPTPNYVKHLGFGEIGRPRMGKRSPEQP